MSSYKIPFAENSKGMICLDLDKDAPHYLIAGATGMGKSCANRVILTTLVKRGNCDLYLTDLKDGLELSLFRDLKPVKGYAETLPALDDLLIHLIDVMTERYQFMKENGMVKWKGRRFLFLLDEMMDLYTRRGDTRSKLKGKIKEHLAVLTAKVRACGGTIVLCTQRPDAQVIDGIIKTNIHNKICFKVVDSDQSQIVLGRGNAMGAYLPEIEGRCFMLMNTRKEIAQVYYLDYHRAKKLLEGVERHHVQSVNIEREEIITLEGDFDDYRPLGIHDNLTDTEGA